jgi:hypothetical protein
MTMTDSALPDLLVCHKQYAARSGHSLAHLSQSALAVCRPMSESLRRPGAFDPEPPMVTGRSRVAYWAQIGPVGSER